MMYSFDDNPTRQKIIMLLNKSKHMTVADLSREMGITPMAVRQHLMSLEKKGIINYVSRKYGIGRPVFLYGLTDKARRMFPQGYGKLVIDILRTIERTDGRKKLDKIFRIRKEKLLEEKAKDLAGAADLEERVSMLAGMLDRDGYMVELERDGRHVLLKQFNCLLSGIPTDYPEACKYELELYRGLLVPGVERVKCLMTGDLSCTYDIPIG